MKHVNIYDLFPRIPLRLWILSVIAFVNFLGYMVVPFLILYLTRVKGYSVESSGLLLTVFGLGGIAGSWAGGKLSDRIGAYNVLLLSFVFSAVAMSLIPQLNDFLNIGSALCALAFVNGAFRPAYDSCVVEICPGEERGRAYSIYVVAINIGAGLAASIGGLIFNFAPDFVFYTNSITSVCAALLTIIFLSNYSVRRSEKRISKVDGVVKSSAAYKNFPFVLVCLAACVVDLVSKQTSATLPLYATAVQNVSPEAFGLILTFGYFLFASAVLPVSSWAKRRCSKKVAVTGMGIVAVAFAFLPAGSGLIYLAIVYLFITIGQILFYPAIMSIVMGVAASNDGRGGEYMGFYRTVQASAGVAAPSIGTAIYAQLSPSILWLFCSVLTCAFALFIWRQRE